MFFGHPHDKCIVITCVINQYINLSKISNYTVTSSSAALNQSIRLIAAHGEYQRRLGDSPSVLFLSSARKKRESCLLAP
jgi:hypothetical protein